MDQHEEFLKAYAAVPSQDNEGYTPDRAGFKCGFGAAWRLLYPQLADTQARLETVILERNNYALHGECCEKERDAARSTLEDICAQK